LNIKRRHLTVSQHNVTGLLMFGDEAKKEAKEAQKIAAIEGNKSRSPVTPNLGGPAQPKTGGEWTERVVEKAHAAGLVNVTKYGVVQADRIVAAPETLARVQSGDLGKPSKAFDAASIELGMSLHHPPLASTVFKVEIDVRDPEPFIRWCRARLSGNYKPMSLDDLRAYRQAIDDLIAEKSGYRMGVREDGA
jgi:hypothetical protein